MAAAEQPAKKEWVAVKDVGVAADRNARHRRKMEDAHVMVDSFAGIEKQAFFGVYDGHGGNTAALYAGEHLHKNLESELATLPADASDEQIHGAFKAALAKTDADMKETVPSAGACVVCALIRPVGDKRKLYVANLGDAKAVVLRNGKAEVLTANHHVDNEAECDRIKATNGFIINGRVNGMIAVTRSLGDHPMKDWLINDPHFQAVELTDTDSSLILACDGVWDVIEPQTAFDFIKDDTEIQLSAKRLVIKSITDGSTDNITVMLVKL